MSSDGARIAAAMNNGFISTATVKEAPVTPPTPPTPPAPTPTPTPTPGPAQPTNPGAPVAQPAKPTGEGYLADTGDNVWPLASLAAVGIGAGIIWIVKRRNS